MSMNEKEMCCECGHPIGDVGVCEDSHLNNQCFPSEPKRVLLTKHWPGDRVYGFEYSGSRLEIIGPMTIGKVSVEYIDSKGMDGFGDNYSPQHGRVEKYMCDETGVGSGTVYAGEHLFATKEEVAAFIIGFRAGVEDEKIKHNTQGVG